MIESVEVTIDAQDAESVAAFWQNALGYLRLYERPPYVVLGPVGGSGPRVLVQQVAGQVLAGSRVHLDLRVADPENEVRRLVGLGATVVRLVDEQALGGSRWWVLEAPEGTPFCVCPGRGPDQPAGSGEPDERHSTGKKASSSSTDPGRR